MIGIEIVVFLRSTKNKKTKTTKKYFVLNKNSEMCSGKKLVSSRVVFFYIYIKWLRYWEERVCCVYGQEKGQETRPKKKESLDHNNQLKSNKQTAKLNHYKNQCVSWTVFYNQIDITEMISGFKLLTTIASIESSQQQ